LFLQQLADDVPGLSEDQRVAVLYAFDAIAERVVVPAGRGLPALTVPGRVSQLVERLDIDHVLGDA
jgi:hypothetical protein